MYGSNFILQGSVDEAVPREGGFLACKLRGYDDGGEHLAAAAYVEDEWTSRDCE